MLQRAVEVAELVGGARRAVVQLVELARVGVELADLARQHVDHRRQLGPLLILEVQVGERTPRLDVLGVERDHGGVELLGLVVLTELVIVDVRRLEQQQPNERRNTYAKYAGLRALLARRGFRRSK